MTGDALGPALALGADLNVTVEAELLPAEKVAALERMGVRSTVFVGDGINDAAALAASDVGIAVAGGSPRSIDAADVYFVRPGVEEVPLLLDLACRAVRTARTNLTWAFAYNGFGLWLAATGRLTPVFAAAAMAASSVIVVLNSARGIPRRAAGEAQVPAPKLGLSAALSDAGS